jgi:hypothetical protein
LKEFDRGQGFDSPGESENLLKNKIAFLENQSAFCHICLQMMSSSTGHELLEVPDTPDRLDLQSGGRSHRTVDARNLKLLGFQEKSLENKNLSSGRRDKIVGQKAVRGLSNDSEQNEKKQDMERVVKIGLLNRRPRSSCKGLVQNSDSSCFSWTSSCGLQLRSSRENGFVQEEGNVQLEGTANSLLPSEMVPTQPFSHQTSKLQRQSSMETFNKISAEDESIQHFNASPNGKVEVRRKGKEIMSSHGILSSKKPQRKALVHNGRISPISIDVDATISEKSMKKIPEVGDNMNASVTDNAYTDRKGVVNEVLKPDGNSLPHVSQQEDRRKGKEIISGHIIECKDSDAPLRQSRKRMRANPLSCEEGDKAVASYNSTSPRLGGLSCSLGEVSSLDCGNDNLPNRSVDNVFEGYSQLAKKPIGCSKIRCHEKKSLRSDRNRARTPYLSLSGDQEHCFEAASSSCFPDSCNQLQQANVNGNLQHSLKKRRLQIPSMAQVSATLANSDASPDVIFVKSSRPLRNNSSSTSSTNAVFHAPVCDVDEAASHEPIDVDSLGSPPTGSVNIDPSNGESDARARQIEEDEMLARQLQEAFQDEVLRDGYQNQDGHLHWNVQRERSTRISAPASGSVLPARPHGFPMSFRSGETSGRESRSLRNLPTRPNSRLGPAMVATVRRRDPVLGRVGRLRRNMDEGFSMRSVDGRRFHFPSYMNLDMRIDLLEALERAADGHRANGHLAGIQRDFNENDYEMLLALDDGNDSHRGASQRHIDRLPVSTVQSDVSDETCSICLEMPRAGEAIRHLLCMHKFHKDCIDPWLSRQATCPICKSSI